MTDEIKLTTWEEFEKDMARIDRKEYESLLERLRYEVWYPLRRNVKSFYWGIRHRTIDRYNVAEIPSLKPGYYDHDTRLLHVCFDLLVDHLEEEAIHTFWSENYDRKKKGLKELPTSYFKKNKKEFIFKHLDWEATLDSPDLDESCRSLDQAKSGRIKKELYIWWTETRPNRPDPYAAWDFGQPKEVRLEHTRKGWEIEANYTQEDNDMLKKLVDVRTSMWV